MSTGEERGCPSRGSERRLVVLGLLSRQPEAGGGGARRGRGAVARGPRTAQGGRGGAPPDVGRGLPIPRGSKWPPFQDPLGGGVGSCLGDERVESENQQRGGGSRGRETRGPRAVGPRVWSRRLWGLHVWEPVETRRAEMELPETAGRGRSVCGKDGVV